MCVIVAAGATAESGAIPMTTGGAIGKSSHQSLKYKCIGHCVGCMVSRRSTALT